jgi:mitochondrial fission protein ELM1
VLTIGALHHADASTLRAAASAWQSELAPLAKPLLIVNVGGPTKHCQFGEDLAVELVSALKQVLNTCGSARISFSGRTPAQVGFGTSSNLS